MQCDVCLEEVGDAVVPATLPCGHEICIRCLTKVMISGSRTCHLCRAAIDHYSVPFRLRTPESGWDELERAARQPPPAAQTAVVRPPFRWSLDDHESYRLRERFCELLTHPELPRTEAEQRALEISMSTLERWNQDDPASHAFSLRVFAVTGLIRVFPEGQNFPVDRYRSVLASIATVLVGGPDVDGRDVDDRDLVKSKAFGRSIRPWLVNTMEAEHLRLARWSGIPDAALFDGCLSEFV